jgi:hypothetical protein
MPGLNKLSHQITHNFFMNANNQIGKKNRVHFKPFGFSKPPIKYRKTPMPIRRSTKKNFKNKRKTMKKRYV